ncbi:nuclear transport factor 2 family protein [Novosphingobium sp. 9U]|uniref:nuclear transport factor 2 family protein n=1 Tax=Novosphingobium sp. 9U TaxID=2653158 RepID=UPI0012F21133|nr:nuclear transport factor 2 family protein [Novosphingobium sp. 9U]VWX54153.1 conserved hypothetical protein [Novosphingobium sp. 9U]
MPLAQDQAAALVDAYNRQDFAAMERIIAPNVDFAHFNRDFVLNDRDELIGILKKFASDFIPDRRFEEPERVQVVGDTVIREGWYVGTPQVDLPGFGDAGQGFRLKFCSVMRFDDAGTLVEWKDYG